MGCLSVRLLGSFQAEVDKKPVTEFESDKVRALLAYLAVDGERPFTREHLAELLWPERSEGAARSNLRHALAVLRQAIHDQEAEPPYLLITRQTIQFNQASDVWVDVVEFAAGATADADRLVEIVELYNGRFLDNLAINDSALFEEWLHLKQEQFERQLCQYLRRLADYYEQQDAYETGLDYAQRWVDLTPWQEDAQRQLIRLLALNGRRSEALAQYETCRRLLDNELGVTPDAETEQLIAQIRAGTFQRNKGRAKKLIRGYELRQQIGAGGFGVVYRATQPTLNREVAVKVILPQFANQPDFIRRFETEAQLIARLEHPHIVPLYDYWREPGGAYLVMRWLRGGNLSQALQNGPWSLPRVACLLDQIAGALTVAHRQGIIHRDVKPANILLDQEGNAYLSDFGVAKDLQHVANLTAPDAIVGSLAYISPEQAQSQAVTPQSDLYSLGMVIFELLTGLHPCAGSTPAEQLAQRLAGPLPALRARRTDLSESVQAIIQQATAREPVERFPGVLAFAFAFRNAVTPPETAVFPTPDWTMPEPFNPYKGLRPFAEADAADFFGRDALIRQLLSHFAPAPQPSRFLAVVGPGGSGKSSVVKAGLLPTLRRGIFPGSDRWFIVEMAPGSHPLDELEIGLLRIAASPPVDLAAQLHRDERGLLRAARLILPDEEQAELLLVVDQFEELYTLVTDAAERAHFLALLHTAVTVNNSRIRVIITLRADFYDRPLLHPAFSRLLQQHTELVLPLTAVELVQAIEEPARRAGMQFESGLAATIAADVNEQSGALPMLQYALTELFERRNGRLLTCDAYKTSSGVSGALAQRAEALYASLDEAGQAATRQIFLRLIALDENAGAASTARRRTRLSELEALSVIGNPNSEDPSKITDYQSPITDFGRHRLLTFDRDPATREPTVEVAHEALLTAWGRLRQWLIDSRDDLRLQRQLAQAVAEWKQAGQDDGFLLRGSRLEQFAAWSKTTGMALTEEEQAYLAACLTARAARQAAEAARLAHEQALEQRSRRFLRALVAVFAAATIVAVTLSLFAFGERRSALEAYSLSLAANAQRALADQDTATALVLALAANQIDEPPLEAQRILLNAAYAPGARRLYQVADLFPGVSGPVTALAVHPTNGTLLLGLADGPLILWNPETAAEIDRLNGHTDRVNAGVISADGKTAVSAANDARVIVWNLETSQEIGRLAGHSGAVRAVDISPDGRQILSGGLAGDSVENPGELILWDAASGVEIRRFGGLKKAVVQAAFAQNGRIVLAGSGDPEVTTDVGGEGSGGLVQVHSWDASSGQALDNLAGLENEMFSLAVSPDDNRALIGSYYNYTAVFWDVTAGEQIAVLPEHSDGVRAIAFSADGTQALTGSDDRSLILWDLLSGRSLYHFAAHDAEVLAVAFSADGRTAFSSARDGSLIVWDLFDGAELQRFLGHGDQVFDVSFSADSSKMLSASGAGEITRGSYDTSVRLWDVATGQQLTAVAIPGPVIFQVEFSPDGRFALAAGADPFVRAINLETGEIMTLAGHGPWTADVVLEEGMSFFVPSLDVNQAHNLALTGSTNGMMILWDATTFQPLLRFGREMSGDPWAVAISPDGRSALTSSDKDVMIL